MSMTILTSANNPLWVDWLGKTPALGLTIAPGKVGTLNGKTHRRDPRADLGVLKAAGADVVVNLMEVEEMARWQMQNYFAQARKVGLETVHFPIRDMDIPDDRAAVRALVRKLHDHLGAGRRVVIHCLGGLGRSGTVAACLLTENGLSAREAVRLVRQFREGAVQTQAQEDFVYAYREIGEN